MNPVAIFLPDHAAYLAEVADAWGTESPVFLGNPQWGPEEMAEAARLLPVGTRVVGADLVPTGAAPAAWPAAWRGRTLIPTGGTGGHVKLVAHDPASLAAAGVMARCESREGLAEEQPLAYKDVDVVVDVVHRAGLSTKVARLRPIGVIKG